MEGNEKPSTPRKEAGGTDAKGRCASGLKKSSKADQESRRTCSENQQTLSARQERERLALWLRDGLWQPQKRKNEVGQSDA